MKLEQRRVLNADFTLTGTVLDLNNFSETVSEDVTITDNGATIDFVLSEGAWNGTDSGTDIVGDTTNTLSIAKSFLTGGGITDLNLDANGFSDLDVLVSNNTNFSDMSGLLSIDHEGTFSGSNVTASSLSVTSGTISGNEFVAADGALTLNVGSSVDLAGLSITGGSDANADISVTAAGTITVSGTISNGNTDGDADISLTANGTNSDFLINQSITAAAGDITLEADDSIVFDAAGDLTATGSGVVQITADADAAAGDSGDQITMADGTVIDGGTGSIDLMAAQVTSGGIQIGELTTSGDVTIDGTGAIQDMTAGETANITADTLELTSGANIGAVGAGDLDVEVANASFTTTGAIHLVDLSGGLTINAASQATNGGTVTANSPLTISADIATAGTMVFTASDSASADDDITINSNATVTLTSNFDHTLTFVAGDDIILDTGSIQTAGAGSHTIVLTADNEGAGVADGDRGSVTNAAGAIVSALASIVQISASDGIGDSSSDAGTFAGIGFRIDAETLTAINTDTNEITIVETDDVALDSVDNETRDVSLTAGGAITDAGDVNVDLIAGTATLSAADGIGDGNALETTITNLSASISAAGDLQIAETDDLVIDTISVFNGTLDIDAGGSIADTVATTISVSLASDLLAVDEICLILGANDFVGAVTLGGSTVEVIDVNDLTITSVAATDDIFLRAGGTAAGTLTLNGNLTTSAVGGQILLQADTGLVQLGASVITTDDLLVGGNAADEGAGIFDFAGTNNVENLAADIDGEIEFTNSSAIVVGSLAYSSVCATAESIVGMNVDDKIRLQAPGITLNQSVNSTTVYFISSAGISQAAAGTITATNLMLQGTGTFDLDNVSNDADNLAADVTGDLEFVDTDDVTIARLTCDADTLCGISVTTNLIITANGNLTQDVDAAVIVTGTTQLTAGSGDICLTGGDCSGDAINDNDFGGAVTIVSANDVEIVDINDLTLGTVTAESDVRFVAGDGAATGTINLTGNVTLTDPSTQLMLQSDDGSTQTNGTSITATQLFVQGTGDFDVNSTTFNSVEELLADIDGSLNFTGAVNLLVAGTTTFDTDCGTSIDLCGIDIDQNGGLAGDLTISLNDASLTQTGSVTVEATTTLTTGTGDICLTGGDCTGDAINDNDFVGTVTVVSADAVEVVDINDLIIGTVNALSDARFESGDGAATGNLDLTGDITLTGTAPTQVLLQSDSGVDQTALTQITSTQLFLQGIGDFNLDTTSSNLISQLVADIDGNLAFTNGIDLEIADLTGADQYASDCGTTLELCGVNIDQNGGLGGDLTITMPSATLTQVGSVTVEGDTVITAANICLTGGDCNNDGLNDNLFGGTLTLTATGEIVLAQNGLLNITSVSGGATGLRFIGDDIQVNTNITTTQLVFESTAGVDLNGSVLTVTDLLLSGTGDFNIDTVTNAIGNIASDIVGNLTIVNNVDLIVGDLTYTSACGDVSICGINVDQNLGLGGNLDLTLNNANLTQVGSVTVEGTASFDVGTGLICLTGGDCNTDGLNDNDFVGAVTVVNSQDAEIVDRNSLTIAAATASSQLRFWAGDVTAGTLTIAGNLVAGSEILLQASDGATQTGGTITSPELIVGGDLVSQRTGDFSLSQANVVDRLSGRLADHLEFDNSQDLQISALHYVSACGTDINFTGLIAGSTELDIAGDLFDAESGIAGDDGSVAIVIDTTAVFDVDDNLVLGDGADTLSFTTHQISLLVGSTVSTSFVEIVNADNVSLEAESSVILRDANVAGTLFVTSGGDILQTRISLALQSTIVAPNGGFNAANSIQLNNTNFDVFAGTASDGNTAIDALVQNASISDTFTGGIANVADATFAAGFMAAGNHDFVNEANVGVVVQDLTGLTIGAVQEELEINGVIHPNDTEATESGIDSNGDVYLENRVGNINILNDITTRGSADNITVVAASDVSLAAAANLQRIVGVNVEARINTLLNEFVLTNARSLFVTGNAAFGDTNAIVDSIIGIEDVEFQFGNLGERSFSLIVGWLVDDTDNFTDLDAVDAQNPLVQLDTFEPNTSNAGDFLISDLNNFKNLQVDGYDLNLDSGSTTIQNRQAFNAGLLNNISFLISQVFLTNDSQINLFEDAGTTDLNFTQELLPTTVNVTVPPEIVRSRPEFGVTPSPPVEVITTTQIVDFVPEPPSEPIQTGDQPPAYFLIKFTEDDDGVYEDEFQWKGEEDADSIRSILEDAAFDDQQWPDDNQDDRDKDITSRIRDGKIKPGMYSIFEVQEGKELDQPVDEAIDRTDIENADNEPESDESTEPPKPVVEEIKKEVSQSWINRVQQFQDRSTNLGETNVQPTNSEQFAGDAYSQQPFDTPSLDSAREGLSANGTNRFAAASTGATLIGSSLLLAQLSSARSQHNNAEELANLKSESPNKNMFSRAARLLRKTQRTT